MTETGEEPLKSRSVVFAVDGGGTTFKTCLLDEREQPHNIESFRLRPELGIGPLRDSLMDIFNRRQSECRAEGCEIEAVGVGCRGIIDSDNLVLLTDSGVMNFFSGHSFRELIETDLPMGAENDAVAAAMGENRFGIGKGVSDFILLTLGTGIGGGIIARGTLYKGHTGMGGHLGHFPVNPDGVRCGCGNVGCVETEFSASAFDRKLKEVLSSRPIEGTKQLFDDAEAGDAEAMKVVKRGVFFLARAISGYANAIDPEKVVLTGGLVKSGDFLRRLIVEELKPILWRKDPEEFIVISRLGADMGLYGAGAVGEAALMKAKA